MMTEEATGPLQQEHTCRSFFALRASELTHPTEKRSLSEGLGTFSAEYTETSLKRA